MLVPNSVPPIKWFYCIATPRWLIFFLSHTNDSYIPDTPQTFSQLVDSARSWYSPRVSITKFITGYNHIDVLTCRVSWKRLDEFSCHSHSSLYIIVKFEKHSEMLY